MSALIDARSRGSIWFPTRRAARVFLFEWFEVFSLDCGMASDDQHRHPVLLSLGGSSNCDRARA